MYFSGVPERRPVGVLHGVVQHGVGTHQVRRLADHVPAVHCPVDCRRATRQGRSNTP